MTRRGWLAGAVLTAGGVLAAIVGIPSLLFGLSPALERRRTQVWRPVGRLDNFAIGGMQKVLVEVPDGAWPHAFASVAVFVRRVAAAEVVVFSRACTDLGCPITWDAGSAWFFCPCHGGIFDADGIPRAGPPSRPLYRYATRIRGGVVEIDLNSLPSEASSAA